MPVGHRLRAFRESRGWSYSDMSDEMTRAGWDVDRMTIVRIEKGERLRFTEAEIRFLARFLGVSPNELVDWVE
jgi:transcriptional regulator with XRE-family HTH domain